MSPPQNEWFQNKPEPEEDGVKRAMWPSVDLIFRWGNVSESKGKHALHRGAVGEVRASSRRL